MKALLKNKNAQIASTLTWIVATFILLFILILYVVFSGITHAKKGDVEIEFKQDKEYDVVLERTFLNLFDEIESNVLEEGFLQEFDILCCGEDQGDFCSRPTLSLAPARVVSLLP